MALTDEEAENIKKQLRKQIESWPEEKRESALAQIEAMDNEQLEQFLIQNKMISESGEGEGGEKKQPECIFCSIIHGKIPSYKIDENKSSLAILDINPLSKGHSMILSKEHKKLPSSAFSFASKIAKKIKLKLKADDIKIENAAIMGHQLINIIPIYKNQKLEKKQAQEKDLIILQDLLTKKQSKSIKTEKIKQISEKQYRLPRRIP